MTLVAALLFSLFHGQATEPLFCVGTAISAQFSENGLSPRTFGFTINTTQWNLREQRGDFSQGCSLGETESRNLALELSEASQKKDAVVFLAPCKKQSLEVRVTDFRCISPVDL